MSAEKEGERAFADAHVFTFGRDPSDFGNPEAGPSVVIRERGLEIELLFDRRDEDAKLLEVRLLPDGAAESLEPTKAREVIPEIDLYLALARAGLAWNWDDARAAAEALRGAARPGRGLSPDFYRAIATEYKVLVSEGEPAPLKTLGKRHWATTSAASRWIAEARRRNYLPPKGAKQDA